MYPFLRAFGKNSKKNWNFFRSISLERKLVYPHCLESNALIIFFNPWLPTATYCLSFFDPTILGFSFDSRLNLNHSSYNYYKINLILRKNSQKFTIKKISSEIFCLWGFESILPRLFPKHFFFHAFFMPPMILLSLNENLKKSHI
jgi:hypothetical protein